MVDLGHQMVDGEVYKLKDEVTRELTKEVRDMAEEKNEGPELVAMLAMVHVEVVGEAMDLVGPTNEIEYMSFKIVFNNKFCKMR